MKAHPPEPPSLARQTWRTMSGAVGVASIPLVRASGFQRLIPGGVKMMPPASADREAGP